MCHSLEQTRRDLVDATENLRRVKAQQAERIASATAIYENADTDDNADALAVVELAAEKQVSRATSKLAAVQEQLARAERAERTTRKETLEQQISPDARAKYIEEIVPRLVAARSEIFAIAMEVFQRRDEMFETLREIVALRQDLGDFLEHFGDGTSREGIRLLLAEANRQARVEIVKQLGDRARPTLEGETRSRPRHTAEMGAIVFAFGE